MERGWKPNSVEISPNCPRCGSSNTKFCYYNNYSSTQPRYFCKGCRRYWTKGGSLRNVPVSVGCHKSTRRGKYSKTLRQANININAGGHDHDIRRASSSEVFDGPNIDLAHVYSSFLKQKPDQLETVFCSSSDEYSSLLNNDFGLTDFSEELDLTDCLHFHEKSTESHFGEDNQVYFCGFNSNQKHSSYDITNTNFELPPLPGEAAEISNGDILWSISNSEIIADHALQATQPPLFGLEDDAEFLMSNCWNHSDLPRDASFLTP